MDDAAPIRDTTIAAPAAEEVKPFSSLIPAIIGAALMIGAAVTEAALGVEAAGRSLEDIAAPLSADG